MNANIYGIDLKKSVLNKGNPHRLIHVMQKALCGKSVTIAFLGGSITQGCLSSTPEDCYAYLVYKWWCGRFPASQITYLNAGIGGTSSQFGVARADRDLLSQKPDFIIVEFSVNDDDNEHFLETYEGLIRKLYRSHTRPAVLIVNSVRYDNGKNAQMQHLKIGMRYDIPCLSMKPCLYEKILDGTFTSRDITADDLHPNDLGHKLMSEVIIDFLEETYKNLKVAPTSQTTSDIEIDTITPISDNSYENSVRYQNYNCQNILTKNKGFVADPRPQDNIREIFRHGWTADTQGARISFCVEGTCIAVQYRKSVNKPSPIARAVIDGHTDHSVILDANFEETWGDSLHLDTLAEHLPYGKHTVEIELTETHEEDKAPFYLVSVITSGYIQAE